MKSNLGMVKRFYNTVRYIDDLLALNNKKFEEEIVNIYPPELTLKRPTESDTTLVVQTNIEHIPTLLNYSSPS